MKHLFKLNVDPKSFNIGKYNPTCKAIIKSLYKMAKDDEHFIGATGDQILEYAVRNRIWSTRQDQDRFHTTWSYYWHKVFKYEDTIKKVGEIQGSSEVEYLEVDEEENLE